MFIPDDINLDFSNSTQTKAVSDDLMRKFAQSASDVSTINIQSHKPIVSKTEFLVPVYIMWRKQVEAPSLLDSNSISDKRKKIVRQAIAQSGRNGILYEVENPLSREGFQRFYDFYRKFNASNGYDLFLRSDYLQKHKSGDLYLISIYNREGEFQGGRLISKLQHKISTDYRAVTRTKTVKEGFDTVCEKIYYDIAVASGCKYMGRGKEYNMRGLGNRSIGMLWNKLKYGYQPHILRMVPRVYVDFDFLRRETFDLVFFVSLENNAEVTQISDQVLNFNFICGLNPNWQEIKSIKEKSPYKVNVYDRDFNIIDVPTTDSDN